MKIIVLNILMIFTASSFAQNWKTFNSSDLGDIELAGCNIIKCNEEDNSLWFGTKATIYQLKEGEIVTNFYFPSSVSGMNEVRDFVISQGLVWLVDKSEGFYSFDGETVSFAAPIQLGQRIRIDSDDSLLIGTSTEFNEGFFVYKDGGYEMCADYMYSFTHNNIYEVFEDSYNRKWISYWQLNASGIETGSGLGYSLLQDDLWTNEGPISKNIPSWNLKKFEESPTNQIWAATDEGLCLYEEFPEDWVIYNKSNTNLPSANVSDMKFDGSGKLWTWLKDTAIAYSYNYIDWIVFDETNSPITPDEIEGFAIDTLDRVWILGDEEIHVFSEDDFDGWLKVDEKQRIAELSVYPNPVQSNLQFTISDPVKDIQITNLLGQSFDVKLMDKNILDCSDLSSGRYILSALTESGWSRESFVVK